MLELRFRAIKLNTQKLKGKNVCKEAQFLASTLTNGQN